MCDYSLHQFPNRLAQAGEDLVVTGFSSGSKGFTSAAQYKAGSAGRQHPFWWLGLREVIEASSAALPVAVCVPPGATLQIADLPERLRPLGRESGAVVTFLQVSLSENVHRDSIRFEGGAVVSMQDLPEGLTARVVSLESAGERFEAETETAIERTAALFDM